MEIKRCGSQPSGKGTADYFTGAVRIDPLFEATEPARVRGASVTFEPSARTAWHTHPLGQTLIITSGVGWVQCWGDPPRGNSPRGRNLVSSWREALAWSNTHKRDEHRHSGSVEWQSRRLVGASALDYKLIVLRVLDAKRNFVVLVISAHRRRRYRASAQR